MHAIRLVSRQRKVRYIEHIDRLNDRYTDNVACNMEWWKRMKIIVGLGNPGPKYAETRHNIGFMIVNELARRHQIKVKGTLGPAIAGDGQISGEKVWLVQPTTFMNRSGEAVNFAVRRFDLDIKDLMVVYDDLDLPLGRVRLRSEGSAGGHNGIKSIIASLGTQDFPRLRFGIGRPEQQEVVDYVLTRFARAEEPDLTDTIARACDAVELWIAQDLESAASRFNGSLPSTN